MKLTNAQNLVLKNWIVANNNSLFDESAVAILNAPTSPDYFVYKTAVATAEIMSNGFDWTLVDEITVGKARIWEWMTSIGVIDPSKTNVRGGINEAFKGTAAKDNAHRLAVYGHCQRKATVIEKMFAAGAGTTTTNMGVGPGTFGTGADGLPVEGFITLQDVIDSESAN